MYTEENARGRFPLRDILLKVIVVIIFLILIFFIISKATNTDNAAKTTKTSSNYDKVFSENLEKMEDASFNYFTKDKLPKETGEITELTLREMINSNLLEAFTDADGNACDVNKSYIRLTKNDGDYTLRVNLECNEKKDYSLMKVGEYDYCEHDICKKDTTKEKKNDTSKKEESKPVKEVEITESSNDTNTSNNSSISSRTNTNNTSNKTNSDSSLAYNNNTPAVRTMYEYKKVTSPVFSNWSSWSSWNYNEKRYTAIKCGSNDTSCLREVQLYSRREQVGTKNGRPVYGTVNYYSYRTRTLISNGSVDVKWSTYNDTNLLNQGYTYTGNTK